jgi:hypothetical protein
MFSEANILAVVVAAVAAMVLGTIFHCPKTPTGKLLAKLVSAKKKPAKHDNMAKLLSAAFVKTLVVAYILSYILSLSGAATVKDGIMVGLAVWLGFIATTSLEPVIWDKKPLNVYLLNNLFSIISIAVMAAILVAWP